MHKWLREIEITAVRTGSEKNERVFVDETRALVDGVYERLKRTVRSNYGKVVLDLWAESLLEELSMPPYEYDTMGGVCMINYAYDLYIYLSEKDPQARLDIVYGILKQVYEGELPEEMGLNGREVMAVVDNVYAEISA